jgi:hypothetical protein
MNRLLIIGLLACLHATLSLGQSKDSKIVAGYIWGLGRTPSVNELTYWRGQADQSVKQYTELHRNWIRQNAEARTAVIRQSYMDAFGSQPTDAEIKYWSKFDQTFAEMQDNHLSFIRGNTGVRDDVIQASYRTAFGRAPQSGELSYWQRQGGLRYATLLVCHETYKKDNPQCTNCATAGKQGSSTTFLLPASTTSGLSQGIVNPDGIVKNILPRAPGPDFPQTIVGFQSVTLISVDHPRYPISSYVLN